MNAKWRQHPVAARCGRIHPELFLAGCGKMLWNLSFRAPARNLALKLKAIPDCSSPSVPRNDRLDAFFRKLPVSWLVLLACLLILVRPPLIAAAPQVSGQKEVRLEPARPSVPADKIIEVIAAARSDISRNPQSAEGYLSLGRALRIAGDSGAATQALDTALKLNARLSGVWYEKGLLSLDGGTLPQATELFRKAVESDAANAGAHIQLASLLLRSGDWTEATTELETVLKLDPGNADAHDGLGLVLVQQGNPEQAAEEFKKALVREPTFAEAQESLGETLLQLGEWQKACAALEAALAGDLADKSMATYALASALKHLGKEAEAKTEGSFLFLWQERSAPTRLNSSQKRSF